MKSRLNPLERLADICKWLKIVSKFCFYFKETETGIGDDALEMVYTIKICKYSSSSMVNIKLVNRCSCIKSNYNVQCFSSIYYIYVSTYYIFKICY